MVTRRILINAAAVIVPLILVMLVFRLLELEPLVNVALGLFPVLLVVLALRPVTNRELASFSRRYRLPESVVCPALPQAIARSRGMRLLGAAVGLSLPALVRALAHDALDTGSALLWGAAGYLGGSLLAALMPIAKAGEPLRTATLVPRRARDYLPVRTLALPAVTTFLSVVAAAVYAVTPRHPYARSGGTVLGWVALSVISALVTAVGVRWVVRRPQPVPDQDVLAVDDALRSHGLHLVVGTGIVIGALAAAASAFQVGSVTGVEGLQSVCILIGVAESFLALFAWQLRNDTWRVRPKVPV